MPRNRTVELYRQFYEDMQLERSGLFEILQDRHPGHTVLYPGCSIHITPSFFFPHVVYVDSSQAARDFFADQMALLQFISRKKRYPQPAYVRFIHQDFRLPLPVQVAGFDLLISIYAGGIAKTCKEYLRIGGILLTDDHHQDAVQAAADPEFELVAIMNQKGKTYQVSSEGLEGCFVPFKRGGRKPDSHAQVEYLRSADYYLFKRVKKKR